MWLTNSASRSVRFIFRFETAANGRAISTDEDTDTLAAGASVLLPASFRVPAHLPANSTGTMRLLAVIDGVTSTTEVPFLIYCPEPAPASIPAFDPNNTLSNLLVSLKCASTLPCNTEVAGPLVIGADSLQRGDAPQIHLVDYALAGQHVLAFAQPADWMLRELAMRTMEPTVCAATATTPTHVALQVLDAATNATPAFLILPRSGTPTPSLPDAATIKLPVDCLIAAPYPDGWRALIETTCSAARASPLLEYKTTNGTALLCLFDLNRLDLGDPAVDRLLRRLLIYTVTETTTTPTPSEVATPCRLRTHGAPPRRR